MKTNTAMARYVMTKIMTRKSVTLHVDETMDSRGIEALVAELKRMTPKLNVNSVMTLSAKTNKTRLDLILKLTLPEPTIEQTIFRTLESSSLEIEVKQ